LRTKLISPEFEDFNYSVFYGEETKANQIMEELQNPPMLSDRKLVILRNFENLHPQYRKKIVDYTENPIPEVVFVIETGKVDMRQKKPIQD